MKSTDKKCQFCDADLTSMEDDLPKLAAHLRSHNQTQIVEDFFSPRMRHLGFWFFDMKGKDLDHITTNGILSTSTNICSTKSPFDVVPKLDDNNDFRLAGCMQQLVKSCLIDQPLKVSDGGDGSLISLTQIVNRAGIFDTVFQFDQAATV